MQRSLAGPTAAVGAALERRRVAVGVRVAGRDAQRRHAGGVSLGRTAAGSDAVHSTQELTCLAAFARVSLQRSHVTDQPV